MRETVDPLGSTATKLTQCWSGEKRGPNKLRVGSWTSTCIAESAPARSGSDTRQIPTDSPGDRQSPRIILPSVDQSDGRKLARPGIVMSCSRRCSGDRMARRSLPAPDDVDDDGEGRE